MEAADYRRWLPEWGPVRWTAVVLALLVLVFTGVSLFSRPAHEVLYTGTCHVTRMAETQRLLAFYIVEVGNTGTEPQERVNLCFLKSAMDRKIFDVSARNFGVSAREIGIREEGDTTVIELGRLEPEKRVRLTFSLVYPAGSGAEGWDTIFKGIELSAGRAKEGDPGMTMVGRAWFTIFGRLLPF